ncbi:hypothetical protein ATANTOWER_000935 [Ataeniobius toweri]|uniref:Uncharacterized protein n=1 Tax=Ataeniobius toweri TaxID=208326 RepID=A0ABU7A408_9TELE|nr:hypothetical protein [Ataeniobius toweri]
MLSLLALSAVTTRIKVGSNAGRLTGERELHPGFLPGTDGTQRGWKPKAGVCEENHRDAAALMWLSGEKSPLATDSPSKWRQFYRPSREWFLSRGMQKIWFTLKKPEAGIKQAAWKSSVQQCTCGIQTRPYTKAETWEHDFTMGS